MSRLIFTVPNSDFSAAGQGKNTAFYNPRSGGSLFAAYVCGTSFAADPTRDLSGNQRHMALTAGAFGSTYLSGSASNYCTLPFDSNDICAGTDQMTWVVLAKS